MSFPVTQGKLATGLIAFAHATTATVLIAIYLIFFRYTKLYLYSIHSNYATSSLVK